MPDGRGIVREVAAAVGLAEGEAGVDAVLAALARLGPVSIRRVSRATDLPVPIVASICGELRKRAVVAHERPARLSEAGRALYAAGRLSIGPSTCRSCRGRAVVGPDGLAAVVRELARLAAAAPAPRLELDQCHCTVESKLRRVLAMHDAGALVGRRVLVLGDDDLVSLAIASIVRRFGSPASVRGVTVVDVDDRVVRFVRRKLARAPFPAVVLRHDLRDPLPPALRRAFDTVTTDPPYTVSGVRLFLARAVEALAAPRADVFLSFGSRRLGAALGVQRTIADAGLVIRSLTRDFNEYVGAGVLGGSSHLYHLVSTDETSPLHGSRYTGSLYTGEEAREAPGRAAQGTSAGARRSDRQARAPLEADRGRAGGGR